MAPVSQTTNERGFPVLPDEFIELVKRRGRRSMSLTELAEEFTRWRRERRPA